MVQIPQYLRIVRKVFTGPNTQLGAEEYINILRPFVLET